jgi:hypothetical protein
VHLNGNIKSLSRETLQSSFKLSSSSYISPDSFTNSPWSYYFKIDLERANVIVFVGYSLYDIDIQKILFENNKEFKEKTFFITKASISAKDRFKLEKFGTIIPIGVEGFGKEIKKINNYGTEQSEPYFESIHPYELNDSNKNNSDDRISDSEIKDFLVHGNIEDRYIDLSISTAQEKPYIIIRKTIEEQVYLALEKSKCVLLCSELGNGKTVFINQLKSKLAQDGEKVFVLQNDEGDFVSDIEKIIETNISSILIIDDYENFLDLIKYCANLNSDKIKLILSSRTSNHDRNKYKLSKLDLEPYVINLDALAEIEIQDFIKIIDNIGYWGGNTVFSPHRKKEILNKECQSQLSLSLLYLFNSKHINNRYKSLFENVSKNELFKNTLFAICLLEVLNLPLNPSLISEVAINSEIYNSELRNDLDFCNLYRFDLGKIKSKSSVFSINAIKNYFCSSYAIDQLLKIAQKYSTLNSNGRHEEWIFQNLVKFSFIERIVGEKLKRNNLIRYYEELKTKIPRLKTDPQYWLQYGMARITFTQLEEAEKYFENAYSLARNMHSYDTKYLDNQKARLLILKAIDENERTIDEKDKNEKSFNYFQEAHSLLMRQSNDVYKFRQVSMYADIYEKCFEKYSTQNQDSFKRACRYMLTELDGVIKKPLPGNYNQHTTLVSCKSKLSKIIEK